MSEQTKESNIQKITQAYTVFCQHSNARLGILCLLSLVAFVIAMRITLKRQFLFQEFRLTLYTVCIFQLIETWLKLRNLILKLDIQHLKNVTPTLRKLLRPWLMK